jgi:hypothetical protein
MPGSPSLPNVRLLASDRPGFRQTDFVEDITTLENRPNNVVVLADALSIDRFAIFEHLSEILEKLIKNGEEGSLTHQKAQR